MSQPQLAHAVKTLPQRDRLLDLPETEKVAGLKKSTLYRLMAEGKFPKPVRLSSRCVRWPESRVLSWVQARIAETDCNAANDADAKGAE